MIKCVVSENCEHRYDCAFCCNYSDYRPTNKKILSPRQMEAREEKRAQKKSEASQRGKRNRRSGMRTEKTVMKWLKALGLDCEAVPMSGALKGTLTIGGTEIKLSSDLRLKIKGHWYYVEVKKREDLKVLYELLDIHKRIYIKNFCYILNEGEFKLILSGIESANQLETWEDKGFKNLHNWFAQDNADLLILKSNYKKHIVCLTKKLMEVLNLETAFENEPR